MNGHDVTHARDARGKLPKINPFQPNSPVNPGMFVGRLAEVRLLGASLLQTRAARPANFMITGERGIGKSSLLTYLKYVAEGALPVDSAHVRFLVVDTDVDANTTQLGLVKKIELGLRRELGKTEVARQFLSSVWEFLQRVEAGTVKVNAAKKTDDEELLLEEFAYSLAELAARVTGEDSSPTFSARYDGILVLVDEADNGNKSLHLGSFFKLLSERLQRRGCDKVMFGLAGLPTLRKVLAASHPSSLRVFHELVLDRLSDNEVGQVIDMCLTEADRLNGEKTTFDSEGRKALVVLSEGYPHFIQQFGYSAFAVDSDNVITQDDVYGGAVGEHGGMEAIGDKYYRDSFFKKIRGENYRQVLRIMADNLDAWITKKEIRARFKGSDTTLDNAIYALRTRNIILPKEGAQGVYRLQHKGFALWIRMFTSGPTTLQRPTSPAP